MEEQFQIISDGSCDLPTDLAEEAGISIVPFYVSFDEKNYLKEIREIGIRTFYQQMVENPGVYPKSSMPSVQDYIDAFKPYVEKGIPVICICITTKFSGSMQSALNAVRMIQEDDPKAEITVIDAMVNTVLQGLLVLEAADMKKRGLSYRETIEKLEQIKSSGRIFFTVGDMEYLKHGGRIQDYSIAVGYGYDQQESYDYREKVVERLNANGYEITREQIPVRQIGATIGVHTGPYPLGLGILEKW